MRKAVPIVLALVVVFFIVRSGVLKKGDTTLIPTPAPTGVTSPATTSVAPTADNSKSTTAAPALQPAEITRPSDPAVAAVMDEMMAAWNMFNSVYAAVETHIPQAAGHPGKTMGKGKYWLRKDSGPLLIHFDLRNEMHIKQGDGNLLVTGEELVTVIDGKHTYTFLNQPMHRSAKKMKLTYDDVLHLGGPNLWRDLVTNNKLTLMPEEMRGSYATKVIKAEPNDGSRTTLNYFDKASGLRVEMIELDEQGQTSLTIKLNDVQINPAMSSEQFKFVVPGGVDLEDLTQSP